MTSVLIIALLLANHMGLTWGAYAWIIVIWGTEVYFSYKENQKEKNNGGS